MKQRQIKLIITIWLMFYFCVHIFGYLNNWPSSLVSPSNKLRYYVTIVDRDKWEFDELLFILWIWMFCVLINYYYMRKYISSVTIFLQIVYITLMGVTFTILLVCTMCNHDQSSQNILFFQKANNMGAISLSVRPQLSCFSFSNISFLFCHFS